MGPSSEESARQESETPRILIISPVRNEGAHITRIARAIAAQELMPDRWVVIDDGSDDGTLEQLQALQAEMPFMTILHAPQDDLASGARDRLAVAVEARNFNIALATIEDGSYTHVMKLDGDVEMPANYLRVLLERFAADPEMGLASGVLVEPHGRRGNRRLTVPPHHVHGGLKLYTRDCFAVIGGMQERLGWDTIDETYARMHGFHTRSYRDLVCMHHRPMASADGTLRGRARHGECAYIVHYGPVWVTLRAIKVARYRPFGLSGVAFLYGYVRSAVRGVEQVPDQDYRRFTRRELRARMVGSPAHH
jgi:biofilm PGA synthesis N-glycosyltransferase PgaC